MGRAGLIPAQRTVHLRTDIQQIVRRIVDVFIFRSRSAFADTVFTEILLDDRAFGKHLWKRKVHLLLRDYWYITLTLTTAPNIFAIVTCMLTHFNNVS